MRDLGQHQYLKGGKKEKILRKWGESCRGGEYPRARTRVAAGPEGAATGA